MKTYEVSLAFIVAACGGSAAPVEPAQPNTSSASEPAQQTGQAQQPSPSGIDAGDRPPDAATASDGSASGPDAEVPASQTPSSVGDAARPAELVDGGQVVELDGQVVDANAADAAIDCLGDAGCAVGRALCFPDCEAQCIAAACTDCGALGEPCCSNSPRCDDGLQCLAGFEQCSSL